MAASRLVSSCPRGLVGDMDALVARAIAFQESRRAVADVQNSGEISCLNPAPCGCSRIYGTCSMRGI